MKRLLAFVFLVLLLGSCKKYSDKVAGTYTGRMTFSGSTQSNVDVIISEISNNRISVESDFFTRYEVEIEKERDQDFVRYFAQLSTTVIGFEIIETSNGLFLAFTHYDALNNEYVFSGEN